MLFRSHGTLQIDSFALSYNPNQALDNDKVYNLYLRSVLIEADTTVSANTMIVPCAFDLKDLVKQALPSSGSSEEQEIKIRINYVKGFNKDTTSCVWAASDVMCFINIFASILRRNTVQTVSESVAYANTC